MPRNTSPQNDGAPQTFLGFFQCIGELESPSWSCNADLKLLSLKESLHLFFNKANNWSFVHFMNWNQVLVDRERGCCHRLPMPIIDLDSKWQFKCTWVDSQLKVWMQSKFNFGNIFILIRRKRSKHCIQRRRQQ